MRKFKLMLAVIMVVGMYACNSATTDETPEVTPADTTHVEEDHSGHNH